MTSSRTPQAGHPVDRVLAIGPGWRVSAVVVSVLSAAAYLPTHPAGVIAIAGAIYVVGLSVILPGLARGMVLRRAGVTEPITVIGRGPDILGQPELSPRWRLAAIALGLAISGLAALIAARMLMGTEPGTYPHAIGSLALATNGAMALAAIAPVPGLGGWAILLALADLRGPGEHDRVTFAVTGARIAAVAGGAAAVVLGAVIGDPMVIPLGISLAAFTWSRAGARLRMGIAERFFVRHTAEDLARPLTAVRRYDERLVGFSACAQREAALVTGAAGELLGALGPRQIRSALKSDPVGARCEGAMIPIRSLAVIPGHAPATAVLADLAGQGFAVVRGKGTFSVVEAEDVGHQLRMWALLGDWSRRRDPDDTAPSVRPADEVA